MPGNKKGYIKTGGRKAGTPNKRTVELIAELEKHGLDIVGRLAGLLNKKGKGALSSADQAFVLLRLMKFVFPERKAIDVDVSEEVKDVIYKTQWGGQSPA